MAVQILLTLVTKGVTFQLHGPSALYSEEIVTGTH